MYFGHILSSSPVPRPARLQKVEPTAGFGEEASRAIYELPPGEYHTVRLYGNEIRFHHIPGGGRFLAEVLKGSVQVVNTHGIETKTSESSAFALNPTDAISIGQNETKVIGLKGPIQQAFENQLTRLKPGGELTIGRNWERNPNSCHVYIPDIYVSALHCTIRADAEGRLWLTDGSDRQSGWTQSLNGTYLNAVPFVNQEEEPLTPQDTIRLGESSTRPTLTVPEWITPQI